MTFIRSGILSLFVPIVRYAKLTQTYTLYSNEYFWMSENQTHGIKWNTINIYNLGAYDPPVLRSSHCFNNLHWRTWTWAESSVLCTLIPFAFPSYQSASDGKNLCNEPWMIECSTERQRSMEFAARRISFPWDLHPLVVSHPKERGNSRRGWIPGTYSLQLFAYGDSITPSNKRYNLRNISGHMQLCRKCLRFRLEEMELPSGMGYVIAINTFHGIFFFHFSPLGGRRR